MSDLGISAECLQVVLDSLDMELDRKRFLCGLAADGNASVRLFDKFEVSQICCRGVLRHGLVMHRVIRGENTGYIMLTQFDFFVF